MKEVAAAINQVGGTALGLSGRDSNLVLARKLKRTVKDPDSNIEKALEHDWFQSSRVRGWNEVMGSRIRRNSGVLALPRTPGEFGYDGSLTANSH